MSKWQKISPAEIKVGDRVRVKHVSDDYEETTSADVKHVTDLEIGIGPYTLHKNEGTWYIRKPKKAKPLTRPDEPPVGSFFRVGGALSAAYRRHDKTINGYFCITSPTGWRNWHEITEPGDTITMLELLEVGK